MKKKLLDSIDVKTPCSESWEEMTGNSQVRFCSHCSKDVYDLSAITRAKAEKLVRDSNGRLCIRYVKDPRGKVITARPRLTQIKHQATVAASVLAASLAFSTLAYAQGGAVTAPQNIEFTKSRIPLDQQNGSGFSLISGLVVDPMGAVVPSAELTLRNLKTSTIRVTRSNGEGYYEFRNVEPADYEIEVRSPGFQKLRLETIHVPESTKLENQMVLKPNDDAIVGDLIIVGEPVELIDKPLEVTEIQQQPLLPLVRVKDLPVMGLFPGFNPEPVKDSGKAGSSKNKKNKNNLPK